jgi:phospholipid/cholesterol/gamma-HCH transport system substrate-binding protein
MARDGDILVTKKTVSTDDMLETLNKTNTDIAVIADNLKMTVTRLNNSAAFWSLLSDPGLPADIKKSVANIQLATAKAIFTVNDLNSIVSGIKNGNGSLGKLLTDTTVAFHLTAAVNKIDSVANEMYSVSKELNATMAGLHQDISNRTGTISVLLKDSTLALNLSRSLDNIQQGTDGFNQNMEALKHNFLLRGYFKKLEKQQQQQLKKATKKTDLYTTPAEKADKKNG